MPALMAMVVIIIGRARLWQASNMASKRLMPLSRLDTIAYSTSKMEFLVAIPISITKPIMDGIERLLSAINKPKNAPPSDKGRAAKIVTGCKKSLNNRTSTKKIHSTPVSMAKPKLANSSPITSASPCSFCVTPAGKFLMLGNCATSAVTSPSARLASSILNCTVFARS